MASSPVTLAQDQTAGVDDHQILIGSCAALDGPAGFLGLQTVAGATAYLDYINAAGGVHGRKIQLLAFDDGYEPAKAELCFKRLLKENVFAAGFFVGTPTAAKYVPLAIENKLPVVCAYTRTDFPTVALYQKVLKTYFPSAQPSFVSLEGFVDAMVLVEGLKRAGPHPTREKLITALESIDSKDIGLGPRLILKYSATDHKGFDNVYTTVVRAGKPEIVDDWKRLPDAQAAVASAR